MSPDLVEAVVEHLDWLRRTGMPTGPDDYVVPKLRGGRLSRQRAARILGEAAQSASRTLVSRATGVSAPTRPKWCAGCARTATAFRLSWARRGRARRTRSTPRVRGRRQRDLRIGGELVEHASRAGAKVVLVGDHRRLPEIAAGGTFRGLAVRTEPIVLTENRRQREEWARRMVDLIRRGEVRDGLELAAEQGSVVVTPTSEAAQAQLVRDWWEATRDGREAIVIAHRRAEVSALNEAAHALMDDAGRLGARPVGARRGRVRCR